MRKCNKLVFIFSSAFLLAFSTHAAVPHLDIKRTRDKAKQALIFCRKKGYNSQYCILIDMSLPSGVKRFVLWDFKKNDTIIAGLVSHGCANLPWAGVWSKDKPAFSNRDGSHCTALGKYRLDNRAYSIWGVHVKYYLAGLEATNNKAVGRQIVFHSWPEVPEAEVYPDGTPEGWGCPAISDNTMKTVDPLVRKQKKHMLLWIYN
jgi:L,D-transpeptidase catalytic domain